MKFNRS
jgi:hypothetical protein